MEDLLAMETALDNLGLNLVKADSGEQALRHLLEKEFAVVLLDVRMPGMDGFETAALIRERERTRNTPIIFVTALANVKTLRGLLPICADCKKIRDDKGYWNKVETYLKKHTDAQFTHGLCPDCVQKYLEHLSEKTPCCWPVSGRNCAAGAARALGASQRQRALVIGPGARQPRPVCAGGPALSAGHNSRCPGN
jgi:CheY-like chemotaxis protein